MNMNERDTNTRHDGEEPQAPVRLVAALKEPPPRRVFVPPTMDEMVLATARRHFSKPPRLAFRVFRSWLFWPATAAACLVMIGLGYVLMKPGSPALAREDLNHDGKVDILDAFALAREVEANGRLPASVDLNGDGVVDRRDAEWIASQAVKLEKGGRS